MPSSVCVFSSKSDIPLVIRFRDLSLAKQFYCELAYDGVLFMEGDITNICVVSGSEVVCGMRK